MKLLYINSNYFIFVLQRRFYVSSAYAFYKKTALSSY